jgi:hypothetical protein
MTKAFKSVELRKAWRSHSPLDQATVLGTVPERLPSRKLKVGLSSRLDLVHTLIKQLRQGPTYNSTLQKPLRVVTPYSFESLSPYLSYTRSALQSAASWETSTTARTQYYSSGNIRVIPTMAATLPGILKACGLFNMIMGSINVAYGQNMLAGPSVFVTGSASSALADSQIRYLGAIIASSGAVIWWTSYDVSQRQSPLAMLGAGVFVGGVGRSVAGIKHGFGPKTKLVMLLELALPATVYVFGKVVGQW